MAYVTATELEAGREIFTKFFALGACKRPYCEANGSTQSEYSTIMSASPSLLVLNDWFTPAWKVRVNRKKQPGLQIN